MYNPFHMKLLTAGLVAILSAGLSAQSRDDEVRVWLIPAENAGPNDIAQGERIPTELEKLRRSLEGTGVRLLNVEEPLAMKARSWNPQFTVPNFQVVATQRKTLGALQRFAQEHHVQVIVRFVTWDEAFGLLSADRTEGPDALPDVAQTGSSWAGYLAARRKIRSRPDLHAQLSNWRDVLDVPASALPFSNDVRLLFYWKRLPAAGVDAKPLQLGGATWQDLIASFREGTTPGDTLVFPTGITLNLLHDYIPLAWAGAGQTIFSTGILGTSMDLTSNAALRVPAFLAGQTRLPLGNGEFRRLISFPESSHEEVARTFVNGGYRATLEPANFIGRWIQDFGDRQKQRASRGQPPQRFWDYAAVMVPPANFKGGSELVVLSKAPRPEAAFALADFLATDSDYTQVLAEAGHLPSGRPGYGIRELVGTLSQEGDASDVRIFSEAVQKAIDQGFKYPDLEQWPTVVESPEVLDLLQRLWRRMGVGDEAGMREAALQVERAVNTHLYWPSRVSDAFLRSWPLLLLTALVLGGFAGRVYLQRVKSLRQLTTVLHLYRASRHESAKILGANIMGLHGRASAGMLAGNDLLDALHDLGRHYVKDLTPHFDKLGADLVDEVQGVSSPATVSDIVNRAFDGASRHFQAWKLMEALDLTLAAEDLSGWELYRYPSMATVILQEWFFNCLKDSWQLQPGAVIAVAICSGAIQVSSSGQLPTADLKTLTGTPSKGVLRADAHGLVLIRDIAYYAFGSRIRVEQEAGRIHLSLPLPIVQRKRVA
jgi:ABC-type glycerol-3-phosphate transport system substrate-binding protein